MKIVNREVGDVVVLDLHGRMVTGEADTALREEVTKLVDAGSARVILNLAGVSYIDSAVLSEIVRTHATLTRAGGRLKLLSLPAKIQDLLTMTRLETVFEAYKSEDEAIRSFQG